MIFQKIWHGDSAIRGLAIPANKINCIITDPPFGVDNQSNMAVTQAGKQYARKIANDESPEVAIETFQNVMHVMVPRMTAAADLYVFTSYQVLSQWLVMCDLFFAHHQFKRKAVLVWEKDGPGMGDLECPWGMGVEFCLFYRRGPVGKRTKRRNAVLHYPQVRPQDLLHPHEKPQALLEDLIKASTNEGDFVVDPFGGSGSLARACKTTNRSGLCIEYDEENYRIAKQALETRGTGLF